MNWIKLTTVTMLAGAWCLTTGCDLPPSPPRTAQGKTVKTLTPADAAETALAQSLQDARVTYAHRLGLLGEYYDGTGAYLKSEWVRAEQANLEEAQTFGFEGVSGSAAASPEGAQASEAVLAEGVIEARQGYLDAIQALVEHYGSAGQDLNAELLENVRQRLDPVHQYMYVEQAEVPPANLRPDVVRGEADELYAEARKLHQRGKAVPFWPNYDLQRQALEKFLEVVRGYPDSTKIAFSAFYIGQIYKNYFHQYHRAAMWYQRAWQWNPTIPRPARYQAAVIADVRMNDPARALELYRAVLAHEANLSELNNEIARRRIAQLEAR